VKEKPNFVFYFQRIERLSDRDIGVRILGGGGILQTSGEVRNNNVWYKDFFIRDGCT